LELKFGLDPDMFELMEDLKSTRSFQFSNFLLYKNKVVRRLNGASAGEDTVTCNAVHRSIGE
jgi:hypothetical protein